MKVTRAVIQKKEEYLVETDGLFNRLMEQDESETLDFKQKFTDTDTFLHDALCMYNVPKTGDKHIVYGVSDDKKIVGVSEHLKSHNFIDILHQAGLNKPFSVQVSDLLKEEKKISIVTIPENHGVVVALTKDKRKLKKNNIYVRHGCTNTPKNETADPYVVAKIVRHLDKLDERDIPKNSESSKEHHNLLNLHGDINIIFHKAIRDYKNWGKSREYVPNLNEQVETYFYKKNMDFTITTESNLNDFREPWAQDTPDPRASSCFLKLKHKNIKINEARFVMTDGGRFTNILPTQKIYSDDDLNQTFYFYYIKNSLHYDLNILLNADYNFQFSRSPKKVFPIFETEDEALSKIEKDYRSGDRLLLSYTSMDGHTKIRDLYIGNYERYPKCIDGLTVTPREYEKLKNMKNDNSKPI